MLGTFLKTIGIFFVFYFIVKKAGKTLGAKKRKRVLNNILLACVICFIVNIILIMDTDIKNTICL